MVTGGHLNPVAAPSREVLIDMFRRATLIKQNDERFRAVIRSGKLAMVYYSPRGQEIIPSAVSVNLTDRDYIVTIYCGMHDMLAKGVPARLLWAEFGGRETGACKGKGGPMHITYPASGVMVTTGIVGASLPIANGLALSAQMRGEDRVSVAYFGDGASNIGAFHEAMNMAAVWKLPVVFVCQNNGYGEHTKLSKSTSVDSIATRGIAYQMPSLSVDGNDPLAMYAAAREAVDRARGGGGPTLIEARTFRFFGHVLGDNDAYMDRGERAAAMARDPVPLFRSWLLAMGHASEATLAQLEATIEEEIDEALEFTLASPFPDSAELRRDVYEQEILV